MSLSDSNSDEDIPINNYVNPSSTDRALAGIRRHNERLTTPRNNHTVHYYPETADLPRSPIDINFDPFTTHDPNTTIMGPNEGTTSTTTVIPIDLGLLRFRLASINTYNGNPEGLNNFIFSCQQVTDHYVNLSEKTTIIMHLKAKLLERASLQLGTRNYVTYDDFYADLRQSFSLGKDLNSYRSDIIYASKKRDQTTLDFAYDVRKLLDLAYDFVQSSNYSLDEKSTICRELDYVAIERIIAACHHDLQRHFFGIQPTEISVVIREIQRDMAFVQRTRQRTYEHNDRMHTRPDPPRYTPRPSPPSQQPSYAPRHTPMQLPPKPFKPFEQRQFQRPAFQPQPRQNIAPASGRYANSHVIKNAYPQPSNFRQFNTSQPNQRNLMPNNQYRPTNGYNPFNRPPPRPTAPLPPTPMEVNTHNEEYDPYNHYEEYYPDDTYENYAENYGYDPYEYSSEYYPGNQDTYNTDNINTQYMTNKFANVQIQNDTIPNETANFPTEASEKKTTL